jgi:hypothetical protein
MQTICTTLIKVNTAYKESDGVDVNPQKWPEAF